MSWLNGLPCPRLQRAASAEVALAKCSLVGF